MDRQNGQRVENRPALTSFTLWCLRRTDDRWANLALGGWLSGIAAATTTTGGDTAAGFAICANLLWCSQVWLRSLDVLLGALDLALVTFRNSLIHRKPFFAEQFELVARRSHNHHPTKLVGRGY